MAGLRGSVVTAFFVTLSLALAGSAAALSVGARAPEIGRPDLNGRNIQMSGLRGKVVIVDFWASWCEPCREEMPVLDRMYRDLRERGLVVVGVSVDRTIGNVNGFLRRTPVSFPIVHDANHEIANRYAPPRMPSSYIIDRRGVVRHVHEGFRSGDADDIRDEVEALLGN